MRLRNSFWALLGPQDTETPRAALERVRLAMCRAVQEQLGDQAQSLQRRLKYAQDIESLWYLRPEIMSTIAAEHGEAKAHACVMELTALFGAHHPGARSARFGSR